MERNFEEFYEMMNKEFEKKEIREKQLEIVFNSGVEAGIKQMMDKIQNHCRAGKSVLCNGELYFFKDARQNLIDIMDDIDAEYGIEKDRRYIVPISISYNGNQMVTREVIIQTNKPETAMLIAIGDFQCNGWTVDTDYKKYKYLED